MTQPDPKQQEPPRPAPTLPPLVDWVSRNSDWLLFLTILTVALLEGVGIYHVKRKANEAAAADSVQVPRVRD